MRQIGGVFFGKDETLVKRRFKALNYQNFRIFIITNCKTNRYLDNYQENLFGVMDF